jgi:hypothetical protein
VITTAYATALKEKAIAIMMFLSANALPRIATTAKYTCPRIARRHIVTDIGTDSIASVYRNALKKGFLPLWRHPVMHNIKTTSNVLPVAKQVTAVPVCASNALPEKHVRMHRGFPR